MANEKTVTRIVSHPNLYLMVAGKLQRQKVGASIKVTEAQAEKMGKHTASPSDAKELDLTPAKTKAPTKAEKAAADKAAKDAETGGDGGEGGAGDGADKDAK